MVNNYYQKQRKVPKKKFVEYIKAFLKKKKRKRVSIIMKVIGVFLRNKSKSKLSIREIIT